MKDNAAAWREKFKELLQNNPEVRVATVDLTRHPDHKFKAYMTPDLMMSCTTKNHYMAVYGTSRYAPPEGRFITVEERAKCMGFCIDEFKHLFKDQRSLVHALGNSIAVPLAGAILDTVVGKLGIFDRFTQRLGIYRMSSHTGLRRCHSQVEPIDAEDDLDDDCAVPLGALRRA